MNEGALWAILERVEKKVDLLLASDTDTKVQLKSLAQAQETTCQQLEEERRSRRAGDAVLHGKIGKFEDRLCVVEGRPAATTHKAAWIIGKSIIGAAAAAFVSWLTWLLTRQGGS